MELEELIKTMELEMSRRDLSDNYLEENGFNTRYDIGIGEYSYGITMIPCSWVYDYLKELLEIRSLKKGGGINLTDIDSKFEELGYIKEVEHEFKEPENGEITELVLYRNEVMGYDIQFWNDKTISKIYSSNYDIACITMEELEIIKEKCKKLGWL